MQRRTLLLSSASLLVFERTAMAATRAPAPQPPDPATAVAAAAAMAAGTLSAERLVRDCLARIAAIDRAGPRLHSVIEVNPDAVAIAKALDGERKAGRV